MIYETENFELDTGLFRLTRDGCDVEIEPQVFDLLVYLIENRERVVPRDELLDVLWKGRVVSDTALSARLKAVRKALGDSGNAQRLIKTVRGRGYRYIGPVTVVQAGVEADPANNRGEKEMTPPLSDKPSIAVLPFTNRSDNPEQEKFADGLTEDVITELSRFRDLFVIASNSSFAYKNKSPKIQEVSRALGVRYVLEGSVQRSRDRVRVSVQLIEGDTGRHLWSERYDRGFDDMFAVQDEIRERIVGTLASGYGGRLRKAWQHQARGTRHQYAQAFDCFMRGLDAVDHFDAGNNRIGRKYFERAIELDPGYARAYGKLAWTYILEAVEGWGEDYDALLDRAFELSARGIECDDGESWCYWALAACYMYSGKQELGMAQFEKAVEINPNDADVLADYGVYSSYFGRPQEGLEYALKAIRLNPHHPEYYIWQLGMIYHDCRRYEEAVSAFESLRVNDMTLIRLYLAACHAALGHEKEAAAAVEHALELDPGATVARWTDPAMAPYRQEEDLEHFRGNLIAAGLPE